MPIGTLVTSPLTNSPTLTLLARVGAAELAGKEIVVMAGHDEKLWELTKVNCYEWDKAKAAGYVMPWARPFGPSKEGSPRCESGSIASGGKNTYCTCDTCF